MSCRHHILIIEDEPDLRETLRDLLDLSGFKVSTAENGQDALARLDEIGQSCLILLDLMMPVMNGWQFLEALKKDYQDILAKIPVVIVSAAADVTDVGHQYGCRAMKKPVDIEQLLVLAHLHCASTETGIGFKS